MLDLDTTAQLRMSTPLPSVINQPTLTQGSQLSLHLQLQLNFSESYFTGEATDIHFRHFTHFSLGKVARIQTLICTAATS